MITSSAIITQQQPQDYTNYDYNREDNSFDNSTPNIFDYTHMAILMDFVNTNHMAGSFNAFDLSFIPMQDLRPRSAATTWASSSWTSKGLFKIIKDIDDNFPFPSPSFWTIWPSAWNFNKCSTMTVKDFDSNLTEFGPWHRHAQQH